MVYYFVQSLFSLSYDSDSVSIYISVYTDNDAYIDQDGTIMQILPIRYML